MPHAAKRANTKENPGENESTCLNLPIDAIRPSPYQPRRTFDEDAITELAASIRISGLIQPLAVRKTIRGEYELIAGERRLRACRELNMETVPCVVLRPADEKQAAMLTLIENVQRRDLSCFEEAESYSAILSGYGMTQETLAASLGKSQSYLANKLRLLKLSPSIRRAIVSAGLSERHARALLALRDERRQAEAIRQVSERGLSVRETEKLIEHMNDDAKKPQKQTVLRLIRDYRLFVNMIRSEARTLNKTGVLSVELTERETETGAELTIRIESKCLKRGQTA